MQHGARGKGMAVTDLDHDVHGNAVRLHPLTLVLSDSALEAQQRKKQHSIAVLNERRFCGANVAIGVFHTGLCVWQNQQTLQSGAILVVPYLVLSLAHAGLCQLRLYERHRVWMCAILDTLYFTACMLSMPLWVLGTASVVDLRSYTKYFFLGSGSLISYYFASLISKPFYVCMWLLPLECAVQMAVMAPSTCSVLDATPFGVSTSSAIASSLHGWSAWLLPLCPSVQQPCLTLVRSHQVVMCLLLLALRYCWETREVVRSLQDRVPLRPNWPQTPLLVALVLAGCVALQLGPVVWGLVACTPRQLF